MPGLLVRAGRGERQAMAEALGSPKPGAVVTERFLRSSGADVGSRVDVPLGGRSLRVTVVKAVAELPATGAADGLQGADASDGGALLLDLPGVNTLLKKDGEAPLLPTEWWLTTRPGASAQAADALRDRPDIDPEQVLVRDEIAAELRDDPLGAGPQSALLAVAVVAAALAAVGFAVSAAGSLRERSAEFAVLRALGAPRRQLARLIAAEQGLLLGLALVVGVALGAVLTRAVVPLIVLTGEATQPVPPVLVELPLPHVVTLLAATAAVPLLIITALALRRGAPTVSLRHDGGN